MQLGAVLFRSAGSGGKTADGAWETAQKREYGGELSRLFAHALLDSAAETFDANAESRQDPEQ